MLDVLASFADEPGGVALSDLAARLRLPRSTVHRLLGLLTRRGFVTSDGEPRRYAAGPELYRISAMLAARIPVVVFATPILQSIVNACEEMALLGVFHHDRLVMSYAAKVEPLKAMRYVLELHVPHSLLWGSTGRAILAFLDEDAVDRVLLRNDRSPVTGKTVERKALRRELALVRQRGYSVSRGQRTPGAVGIAAPYFDAGDRVAGSLSITVPESRFDADKERDYATLVRQGSAELSRALGAGQRDL